MGDHTRQDWVTVRSQQSPRIWPSGLVAVNVMLGLLVWGFWATDYSWRGTLADLFFAPSAGAAAILSLLLLWSACALSPRRVLALSPALVGGGLAILFWVVIWIPPFTLGALFYIDEVANEQVLQRAQSPDSARTATVTFRGVGAYDGGNGRVSVQVTHRALPLVEREVFYEHSSHADENTREYVRWTGEHSLEIVGEPDRAPVVIDVGRIP